ncbi:MAG: DNA primase [candidate division Zixibacteria bacterium]|nr:DNA primase [candidate division Zixibacteria bacterium]MDH3936935.1 DNA primase [candidate division Zixibacteria bacterium]
MIPPETIEQVRQANDIVQIIGEYVRLKKRGKNFLALCPFHTEKTPSFSVSEDKQIYYCFGCGKGGNLYTFLIEHEHMSFVEAVRHLAGRANIIIREERASDGRREVLERIGYANQVAVEYYQRVLRLAKYHNVLEDYLKGKRNITDEAIEHFQMGLAGDSWDGLIKHAASKDLNAEELSKAGLTLLSEKTKNYFDRFRKRLMIPIHSLSRKPIAFGGRTLEKGEPAKYMNSPETPLYQKSQVLYGLNLARDDIRNSGAAIVVEGYFDVIALWQVGFKNVVASSGTAFSAQQARLLARFAEEVYLFFDADSAGRQAALRSVDLLYDAGMEVKVMTPPTGEDPDSVARQYGRDRLEELQADAIGYIEFRVRGLDISEVGIIGKEKLVKELAAVAGKIADPTRRSLFLAEAADQLQVDIQLLRQGLTPSRTEQNTERPKRIYNPDEFEFLSLLLNNPGAIDDIAEKVAPDDFDSKQLSRLYMAVIEQYRSGGVVDARRLIDQAGDAEFASLITQLAARDWPPDDLEGQAHKALAALMSSKRKRIRKQLRDELSAAEAAGDNTRADQLLREIRSFDQDAD